MPVVRAAIRAYYKLRPGMQRLSARNCEAMRVNDDSYVTLRDDRGAVMVYQVTGKRLIELPDWAATLNRR